MLKEFTDFMKKKKKPEYTANYESTDNSNLAYMNQQYQSPIKSKTSNFNN